MCRRQRPAASCPTAAVVHQTVVGCYWLQWHLFSFKVPPSTTLPTFNNIALVALPTLHILKFQQPIFQHEQCQRCLLHSVDLKKECKLAFTHSFRNITRPNTSISQMQSTKHEDNAPFVSSDFFNDLTRQWREEAEVTRHANSGNCSKIYFSTIPEPAHTLSGAPSGKTQ